MKPINYDSFWPITRQPGSLVERASEYAKKNFMTRSELTRKALDWYLNYVEILQEVEEENLREIINSLKSTKAE